MHRFEGNPVTEAVNWLNRRQNPCWSSAIDPGSTPDGFWPNRPGARFSVTGTRIRAAGSCDEASDPKS
jgi:hypothetical protein